MGSPISSMIVEIFLQYCEEYTIKHHLEYEKILFYNRYVDDILMIFDSSKTTPEQIVTYMNNIHHHLAFKQLMKKIMQSVICTSR
jgi:hypothetical protein